MKKKIISVLAVLAMLVFACGTAFSAEFSIDLKGIKDTIKKDVKNAKSGNKQGSTTGTAKAAAANTEPNSEDDFDWKVNDDFTEITITKYKGTRKDVVIPATIQDVPVTRIGNNAFHEEYDYTITSVVIPEGVKIIEGYYDNGYHGAFCGCRKLESVTLPENIVIGGNAFTDCGSLQSIEIPKGCRLETEAFRECNKLESVTLPEGLKIIPNSCFYCCESLTNINFPSTLKYIGGSAFRDCPFTSVELPEGLEYIGYNAFTSNTITSVSLPKSLKWISGYPIIKSDNINTITIAEGCAPKAIVYSSDKKEGMDGRDIIKGASIDKSLKLQKQLAALKLTQYQRHKDGDALKKDLMSYGFTEKEANNKL